MSLIINKPWECPGQHWVDGAGGKLEIKPERRPASYEVFGTERLTGALLDRLTHLVNILEMNGESYRLAQSLARSFLDRKLKLDEPPRVSERVKLSEDDPYGIEEEEARPDLHCRVPRARRSAVS